jgi:hypothetical protein
MTTQQAVRRWIMTAAVAGVTMTGTIYGATLKSEQDVKKVRPPFPSCYSPFFSFHYALIVFNQALVMSANTNSLQQKKLVLEATPEERIAQLQVARNDLVAKRSEMERKIAGFHERRAKEEGR